MSPLQTWSGSSEDSKKRKVFLKFKADSSSWVLGSGPYRRKGCIRGTGVVGRYNSGYTDNVWEGFGLGRDLFGTWVGQSVENRT